MRQKIKDFILLVKIELILCIASPILTAVMLNANSPQIQNYFPIIMMALFCVFVYGIVKMFFRLKKNDAANIDKPKSTAYRIFIVIAAIIMPFAGLALNSWGNGGLFGNFTNIWFYIIAVLNGLFMLADTNDSKLSLILFYLKAVGFTYITYFTIVFIPYLPFGFIGLIFYGLGILIFAPVTVFIAETFQILQDIRKLKDRFKAGIVVAAVLGVVTIPAVLTANFMIDKANFDNALTYLSADSWNMPAVSTARLNRTLKHIGGVLESSLGNHQYVR